MHLRSLRHLCEAAVLALLAFTVLWKGGKSLESTWLLLGVGAGCIILQFVQGKREYRARGYDIWPLLMLFLLWTAMSYLFSHTQNYGLDELLRTAGLVFLFIWILEMQADDPKEEEAFIRRFVELFTLITVLSCLVGILVYIAQPVNRFVGTFFDWRFQTDYWPNAGAQFLLLAWPIVLLFCGSIKRPAAAMFSRDGLLYLLYRYGPISLALGSLFLTYSRGALIAFVGQVGLLTLLILRQRGAVKTLQAPLSVIGSALLVGLVLFVAVNEVRSEFHAVQSVQEKLTFTASEGTSSVSERVSFWGQAITLMTENPIVGWGPYSFRFVQPRLQATVLATSDHPHNLFLKLGMERGVPALILFLIMIIVVLKPGVQLALTGKRFSIASDHARIGYALLITSIAGVLAHNLIDYNLQFVGIALPFWILMAIVHEHSLRNVKGITQTFPWFTARRKAVTTTIAAGILLIIAMREGYYLATSSLGRHAEVRGEYAEALDWYAASEDEWFSRDLFLSAANLHLGEADIEGATASLYRYLGVNGEDARAWKILGEIHALDNKYQAAIDAYERAFALGGWNDLSISRGLLEALFAETYTQPTSDAAADSMRLPLLPRIAEISPEIEKRVFAFRDAIMQNLHFVALSPNVEEAQKLLITLSVLYPEKAEIYRETSQEIQKKAEEERAKIRSRPPGWLW